MLDTGIIQKSFDHWYEHEPSLLKYHLRDVVNKLFLGDIKDVSMSKYRDFYNKYKDDLSEKDKVKLYAASFRSFMLDDKFYKRPEEPDLSWMTTEQIKEGRRYWRKHEWDDIINQEQYDDIEDVIDEELDEREHEAYKQAYIDYENRRYAAREAVKHLPKEIQDKIIEAANFF